MWKGAYIKNISFFKIILAILNVISINARNKTSLNLYNGCIRLGSLGIEPNIINNKTTIKNLINNNQNLYSLESLYPFLC